MLEKINSALLLSDVPSFVSRYKNLALESDVILEAEDTWNSRYRVGSDIVIAGSKFLDDINEDYYPVTVLILKKGESPSRFIKKGIERFIFNYEDDKELSFAFYRQKKQFLHFSSANLEETVADAGTQSFRQGNYDFWFDKNVFRYKGEAIYLCESAKKYLAEWLLHGHKDNGKRMVLYNIRKRLGKDFLKDIDRYGRIKEEKK